MAHFNVSFLSNFCGSWIKNKILIDSCLIDLIVWFNVIKETEIAQGGGDKE